MRLRTTCGLLLAGALVLAPGAHAQDGLALESVASAPPAPVIAAVPSKDAGPADPLSVTPEDVKKHGSLYLRCDGQPNNITDAESFARLLGAVTLLGIFAPSPEAPDGTKRLFAQRGVAACDKLLDDPTKETNGLRRLPLILARAAHRIEAKDYQAAIADVTKARGEAQALGLAGNPYFDRSMGLSFDLLESQAMLRMGDAKAAQQLSLRNALSMPYSYYAGLTSRPYGTFLRTLGAEEEQYFRNMSRINGGYSGAFADRLEEVGRFAEAADWREDIITAMTALDTANQGSWTFANAAISHALAGNWDKAVARAAQARGNMERLVSQGKPESDQSAVIERLDLYDVLLLAHQGKLDDARRNFAARSQWIVPSFGSILATNAMLRKGARLDQMFGSLAMTPDSLWKKREADAMAKILEADTNNRVLFSFILPYAKITDYERISKQVWDAGKSKLISKEPLKGSRFHVLHIYADALTQPEALLLHAALLAKARGYRGFSYVFLPRSPETSLVMFGNPGDADMPKAANVDADAVIADLRNVIPSPADLAIRRKAGK